MEKIRWTEPIGDAIDRIQERTAKVAEGSWPDGLRTGLTDLDNILGGFRPASLNILAARPAMGKTALALDIARHVAVEEKRKTLYVNLREGADTTAARLICATARVDFGRLRSHSLKEDETTRVREARERLKESPLHLCEGCGLTFEELEWEIFQLTDWTPEAEEAKQLKLVVIDSLEELAVPDYYIDDVPDDVPEESSKVVYIMECLRKTVEFQKISLLLLAGLSEDVDRRRGHRPRPSDLAHFHYVAKYADTLLLLYRPGFYGQRISDDVARLIVPINRRGRTGIVFLKFERSCMRFDYYDDSVTIP